MMDPPSNRLRLHWPKEKRTFTPLSSFYTSVPALNAKLEVFIQGLPGVVKKDWDRIGKDMSDLYTPGTSTAERRDGRGLCAKEAQQACAKTVRERHKYLFIGVPDDWAEVAVRAAEFYYRKKRQKKKQKIPSESDDWKTLITAVEDRFTRLTRHDLEILESIRGVPLWTGLISPELLASLTSLDVAITEKGHPLWTDSLPEVSNELTPTEATFVMWTTRLIDSPNVTDILVKRGNVATNTDEEKRTWAQSCLGQIGAKSVTEPLYTLAQMVLSKMEPIEPLSHWTTKKPSLFQHPGLGVEVMVTPTGGFTDIHADSTTIGRAICIGQCEKLWLLWPPTLHNLHLWASNRGLGTAILRYGAQLEGGLVVHTAGSGPFSALTMPAGTLHSVFTIKGGFLAGVNYTTSEDIQLAGTMLELQVQRSQDEDQIRADCQWFISTAQQILSSRPDFSVQCITALSRIVATIEHFKKKQHPAWTSFLLATAKLYQTFRKQNNVCPCGKVLPPKLDTHFISDPHEVFHVVSALGN